MNPDTIVIGGGAVGLALAWGLARDGERVTVLDEADVAHRASRGNFGLVWVQGKGLGHPAYAHWSMQAGGQWPAFAAVLREASGIDVELSQPGGLYFALDEQELQARERTLRTVRSQTGADYPFEVLDHAGLLRLVPQIGPIAGAVYCPMDGHVSPLKLLRALATAFHRAGGTWQGGARVDSVQALPHGGFRVRSGQREYQAARLVLAAGLGNRELAPMVGLHAPVSPVRGQILVSERLQSFMRHPSVHVRQTGEGVVQIGDSKEEVGFDEGVTLAELSRIAARAVRCLPLLAQVNIVRTWGALRVMSPDGLPLYQASRQCAGAFLVSCHSGITLASLHASALARWIRGDELPAIHSFNPQRFHVPSH